MSRRILAVLLAMLFAVSATACSTPSQEATPSQAADLPAGAGPSAGKELSIAMAGDPTTWNPYNATDVIIISYQNHVFEGLLDISHDSTAVPALATSWESSEDLMTWTFHLREGVTFHNGNPFNADDVVFSYELCKNTPTYNSSSRFSTVESVTKIDDYTVEIKCNAPCSILHAVLDIVAIIDKETYEGQDDSFFETTVVGTGPYKLAEYVRDDKTVFVRNEEYWGEKPEAAKVTMRVVPNAGTRVASLLAQEVDMIANVPVQDAEQLKARDFLTVVSEPSMGVWVYTIATSPENPSADSEFPVTAPDGSNPLEKRDVRLAIASAINYQELIDEIMKGYATMAPTIIPEGFNGYNPNIQQYAYDPEKAEQLLDAAGYPRQADGYRFSMALDATNDRYINDAAVATAICAYLDKVGIKCEPNIMSRSVFWDYITIHNGELKSAFSQANWSNPAGESVLIAKQLLYGVSLTEKLREDWGTHNRSYYNNPRVNELIDQAFVTGDWAERDKLMQELWQIAHDDVVMLTAFFTNDIYAVNNRVSYNPRVDQEIYAMDFTFNR